MLTRISVWGDRLVVGVGRASRNYAVLSGVVAVLILGAAALQWSQVFAERRLSGPLLLSIGVSIILIVLEICVGVWLLSRFRAALARKAAIGLFLVFCLVNVDRLLRHSGSCGCFGPIQVHPVYTLLLDLLILVALCRARPLAAGGYYSGLKTSWCAGIVTLGVLLTIAQLGSYGPTASARHVVVDPAPWRGHRLPLLAEIDVGKQLSRGRWLVIFYQPNCERCRQAISHYHELARDEAAARLALIDVSSGQNHDEVDPRALAGSVQGQLNNEKIWVVRTPLAVILRDGVVDRIIEEGSP